jgi:hypothetical protein
MKNFLTVLILLVCTAGFSQEKNPDYGIFIFNVETVEEAQVLVDTDPTIKSKILVAELTPWFATAALMEVTKIHNKISKNKP